MAAVCGYAAENVYRNGPADQATSSFFRLATVTGGVSQQWGDQVTLAGTSRTITGMVVYTMGDFLTPTGNEKIRIRFYANDGREVGAQQLPEPETVLWDSGPVTMKPGWRAQYLPVPSIVVPDTFTWSATFEGTTGMPFNRAGLCYFGPPTVGTSGTFIWRKDPGQDWTYQSSNWSNGATAYGSFGAAFWADGDPAPVVFDTTQAPTRAFRVTPTAEIGDDALLVGGNRFVSTAKIEYVSEVVAPQGDERARVRIYSRDETSSQGLPLAVLYDSGTVPIDASLGEHLFVVYPEMELPEDVVWTIEFFGVSQEAGDRLTLPARTDPSPGASVPTFWFRENGIMTAFWFGDPTYDPTSWPDNTFGYNNIIANLSAQFVADIAPTVIEHNTPPTLNPGQTSSGSPADLLLSDNVRWALVPGIVLNPSLPPIVVVFEHTLPTSTASSLRITLESRATAATMKQEIQAWNVSQNAWVTLDTLPFMVSGATPDMVRTVEIPNPADYIGANNLVRVRCRWRLTGPVLVLPWRVFLDREYLAYRP